jgi:cytochrome c
MQHHSLARKIRLRCAVLSLAVSTALLASCIGGKEARAYQVATGGLASRGEQVIAMKNCGSCHTIPGISGARGLVGPPLFFFSRRTYIAGMLPNEPDNLVHWVMEPRSVNPKTAMPNLGLTQQQARDVAAYLYTLE